MPESESYTILVKLGEPMDEDTFQDWLRSYVDVVLEKHKERNRGKPRPESYREFYHISGRPHANDWVRSRPLLQVYWLARVRGWEPPLPLPEFNIAWPLVTWNEVVDRAYREPWIFFASWPQQHTISDIIEKFTGYQATYLEFPSKLDVQSVHEGNRFDYYYRRELAAALAKQRPRCRICGRKMAVNVKWAERHGIWVSRHRSAFYECTRVCNRYTNMISWKSAGLNNKERDIFRWHHNERVCSAECHNEATRRGWRIAYNLKEERSWLVGNKRLLRHARSLAKSARITTQLPVSRSRKKASRHRAISAT